MNEQRQGKKHHRRDIERMIYLAALLAKLPAGKGPAPTVAPTYSHPTWRVAPTLSPGHLHFPAAKPTSAVASLGMAL